MGGTGNAPPTSPTCGMAQTLTVTYIKIFILSYGQIFVSKKIVYVFIIDVMLFEILCWVKCISGQQDLKAIFESLS